MSIGYGTSIVRDGLVLHLDTANVKSYPGSGTVWKDLSGNGNDFNIVGADYITSPSPHFSLIDNQGDYVVRSTSDVVGGLDDFSFDMCMRIDSFSATLCTFISYATVTNNNAILFGRNGNGRLAMWLAASNFDTAVGPTDSDYNIGEFIHFVLTRSGTNVKVYINGELKSDNNSYFNGLVETGGTLVFGQEQDSPEGGFSTGQDFPGDFASIKVYGSTLTESEVKQNFEALRGRYGI